MLIQQLKEPITRNKIIRKGVYKNWTTNVIPFKLLHFIKVSPSLWACTSFVVTSVNPWTRDIFENFAVAQLVMFPVAYAT